MQRFSTVVLCLALIPGLALAAGPDKSGAGLPTFVTSDNFGYIQPAQGLRPADKAADAALIGSSAVNFLNDLVTRDFRAAGGEDFVVKRAWTDDLGKTHVRLEQTLNGLRVVGAEMIVHADAATGRVEAVNGYFAPNHGVALPGQLSVFAPTGGGMVKGATGEPVGHPDLVYYFDAETGATHLAWQVRMVGEDAGQPFDDIVYVDARTSRVVAVDAQLHTAKSRRTYDAENVSYTSPSMPGTLLCTDNQSCGDSAAQSAHDGAGDVYDYYSNKFGRDSLNDGGMTLISSVHVLTNWNNAAWYNNQMIYGDGDGVTFTNLALGYDVIAHELTPGVTDFESNLVYHKEPGALNEGLSDIFAAAAESDRDGNINNGTWKVGEDIYTPGTNGDALRYMDNPTLDGYSADYYPERLYAGNCQPSSSNDYCGVHGNSGIANLAFQLLVEGGTHPRGKTSEVVSGVGMSTAEQVFYRAQTTYLTSQSSFSAARTACESAASDLFAQSVVDSVSSAWCAVGVGSCGGSGGCSASGASCTSNSDCCSNKCRGRRGRKTCR